MTMTLADAQSAATIHLELLSDSVTYTLALPAPAAHDSPRPLVVSLHFGGPVSPHYGRDLLENVVEPALRPLGAVMLAPDCPQRAWLDCEESVLRVVEHVIEKHNVDRTRVVLTGYSKGGIGTWDLALRHPQLFSVPIVMAAQPTTRVLDEQWTLPVRVIQGGQDEVFALAPSTEFIEILRARNVDAELEVLNGVTHFNTARFIEPLRQLVPWIRRRWQQQKDL